MVSYLNTKTRQKFIRRITVAKNRSSSSRASKTRRRNNTNTNTRSIYSRTARIAKTQNILKKHFKPQYYSAVLRIDQGLKAKTIKNAILEGIPYARQQFRPHRFPVQRKMRGSKSNLKRIPKCRPRPDPNSGSGGGKLRFVRFCK